MSRKIVLMVGAALVALLVLTAVQARGPGSGAEGPYPRVDVSTTFDAATETEASGTIRVCNVSEDPVSGVPGDVTIETIDDNLFYREWHGHWQPLVDATATVSGLAGVVIPAGECAYGTWGSVYYTLPEGTITLKNEVQVTIAERDKDFFGRECFDFGR